MNKIKNQRELLNFFKTISIDDEVHVVIMSCVIEYLCVICNYTVMFVIRYDVNVRNKQVNLSLIIIVAISSDVVGQSVVMWKRIKYNYYSIGWY